MKEQPICSRSEYREFIARDLGYTSSKMISDTSPEIERLLIRHYAQMTPSEKLKMVAQMAETIRRLQLAEIRSRYPDTDDRECFLRMASRWAPPELLKKFLGWDVEQQGY